MSDIDDNETFLDTSATPSASRSAIDLASAPNQQKQKKRKIDDSEKPSISESNQAKFKVLKKLNVQLTRTKHHIKYLSKCVHTKTIPKSLRVNITPQVPVINSVLQLKWEEAQLNFGFALTKILLEYWEERLQQVSKEIASISEIIKQDTDVSEINFMMEIIERITLNVERELTTNKKPNNSNRSPGPSKQ